MLHEQMENELFNKKSLGALIYLLDKGREFEFSYNNTEYFISCCETEKYVGLWKGKNEEHWDFDKIEMLCDAKVFDGKSLLEIWEDIEINYLY